MADLTIFNPIPPGRLDDLVNRSSLFSGWTKYQEFCFRVARESLNLPVPEWYHADAMPGMQMRHRDVLCAATVQRWLTETARLDPWAGMVALDAMHFLADYLFLMTGKQDNYFLDSDFKRNFTKTVQGTEFVFRVPSGWELRLFGQHYDEGNYGVAHVTRCHLSQNTADHYGWGDLVERGGAHYRDLGYFGIPCEIGRKFKRMPVILDEDLWHESRVPSIVPYQMLKQVVRYSENGRDRRLEDPPTDDQILTAARSAVDAVHARYEDIRRRQRDGNSSSDG